MKAAGEVVPQALPPALTCFLPEAASSPLFLKEYLSDNRS
jgi:hypothetical protein